MQLLNDSYERKLVWLDVSHTKTTIHSVCKLCGFEISTSVSDGLEQQERAHLRKCRNRPADRSSPKSFSA